MKIQKGVVSYKGNKDIICLFGVTEDGKQYYFLVPNEDAKLKNGARVATINLIEAVDPTARATGIGVVGEDGTVIIPFVHRAIRPIDDDILLAEVSSFVSQSVIDANNMRSDPLSATKLVSTPSFIKEKMNAKMGNNGRYVFNDQFSEATVYDIYGNNLLNGNYYSFIAIANGKIYASKNVPDSDIDEFVISSAEVEDTVVDEKPIDVSSVEVPSDVVENALNNENINQGFTGEDVSNIFGASNENEQVLENNVQEAVQQDDESNVLSENMFDEPVNNSEEVNSFQEEAPVSEDVSEKVSTLGEDVVKPENNSEEVNSFQEELPESEDVFENVSALSGNMFDEPVNNSEEVNSEELPVSGEVPEKVSTLCEDVVKPENNSEEVNSEELPVSEDVPEEVSTLGEDVVELEDNLEEVDSFQEELPESEDNSDIFDAQDEEEFKEIHFPSDKEDEDDEYTFNDINVDSIDDSYTEDDTSDYKYDNYNTNQDTIIVDVAKSMTGLMRQNRELKAALAEGEDRFNKLASSRKNYIDKSKMQGQKIEMLLSKIEKLEDNNNKLAARNQILEHKANEQEKIINAQSRELRIIRPQLKGKEELQKLLVDAKNLLNDDNSNYEDDLYYNKAA